MTAPRQRPKPAPVLYPNSRNYLTRHDLSHFAGDTLFDRIARVVCEAGCLPRKELYESWAVARRVRRRFRGGRIVELAAGHALTASLLLLMDDASPCALALDTRIPASAPRLLTALAHRWPRLEGRVTLLESAHYELELQPDDVLVSVHACGALTDLVLERALAAQSRVAVLPCCHDKQTCDTGNLEGWLDIPAAIDATRALTLRQAGYRVHTQCIPVEITPKNRLLLGWPERSADG
ncbi:MAG TPA: methyltransferase [Polyangiales bacterium]